MERIEAKINHMDGMNCHPPNFCLPCSQHSDLKSLTFKELLIENLQVDRMLSQLSAAYTMLISNPAVLGRIEH